MNELVIKSAETALKTDLSVWFKSIRRHLEANPSSLLAQVDLLSAMRNELYEDINQLQHRSLILAAAKFLAKKYPQINKWAWHPEQTSHIDFADLTGFHSHKVILNAEVTTSVSPVGTIDIRMSKTLISLNKKPGNKYYIVRTEQMERRALSKIQKQKFDIEVVRM